MKLVRHFLLGTTVLFPMVVGAQARDLQPDHVRICPLYGEGFYYIPGTDTCVWFGGKVRADYGWNVTGVNFPVYFGVGGAQTRQSPAYNTDHRADFDFDARTQTGYGTLRTVGVLRIENAAGANIVTAPRAFIQWAGWTFGHVRSLSDVPAFGEDGARVIHTIPNEPETRQNGNNEVSYTWEMGNGMALHVGAGERRVKPVSNLSSVVWSAGNNPTTSIAGQTAPNPFVAFKVSEAWGRWDTSITGTQVRANYYTAGSAPCTAQPGTTLCDHPSDTWGWATQSGLVINTPWIAPGALFGVFGAYGAGASAYVAGNNLDSPSLFGSGNTVALGPLTDAVYLNGAGFQLTTAWTAGAYFTHFWTPQFSTTVFGSHSGISYNDTVVNNRWFCGGLPGLGAAVQSVVVPAASTCDPSWGFSAIGTHTDWYPVPSFRLGVEVLYTKIDTAFSGSNVTLNAAPGGRPVGLYTAKNEGITSVMFRAARAWPAGGD